MVRWASPECSLNSLVLGKGMVGPNKICIFNHSQIVRSLVQHYIFIAVALEYGEAAAEAALNTQDSNERASVGMNSDSQHLLWDHLEYFPSSTCIFLPTLTFCSSEKFSSLYPLLARPAFQNSFLFFILAVFSLKYISLPLDVSA